jgi:hypothetical protein
MCGYYKVNNFEYFLKEPSYLGEKMFIMKKIGRCEVAPNDDQDVITSYNTMHVVCIMWVECGIGGLKKIWRWLMKKIDST